MRQESEKLFFEGNRLLGQGDLAAAGDCFRQACALQPDFAEGWANLALVLDRQGQLPQAELAYRKAMQCGCDAFELHLNFGALLGVQKRFSEARQAYAQAMRCNPESAALWSNLGALQLAMKQDDQARACLEKALALQSTHAKARFNLAYLHLRQGNFEEGWRCLEARDWYAGIARHLPCPRWNGEPVAGRNMLLSYEAGHGDVIQFVRYVPLLKAAGAAHITLICHPALCTLMATLTGLDLVCPFDQKLPDPVWDYWCPLLSLPYHFQTRADHVPAPIPYLRADPDLRAHWRKRLAQTPIDVKAEGRAFRAGLVWKGNPAFENDSDRSIADLQLLEPLLALPAIHFVSLQKGAGESEPEALNARRVEQGLAPYPIQTLGCEMRDFADAAAIVCQLDLVISVDTAMAHLAGALGIPCWLLLPDYMTDWRWGDGRDGGEHSPWYPHAMRLWRQLPGGNWPEVIARIAAALPGAAPPKRTPSP